MFLESNRELILEVRPCTKCEGTGYVPNYRSCPNNGMKDPDGCIFCGTTTANSHNLVYLEDVSCSACKATGGIAETTRQPLAPYLIDEIPIQLAYDIPATLVEHAKLMGKRLITTVFLSVLTNADGILATRVVISPRQGGYKLEPYWD